MIVDGAVTSAKIANGTITNTDISDTTAYVYVQNSSGTTQFKITDGSRGLRFASSGIVSIGFNPLYHTVTISATESDPKVGTLTSNKWCTSDGSKINCTANPPVTSCSACSGTFIDEGQSAGGDLSGTYPNPKVVKIQGRPVSSTAPSSGQVLKWNGSQWVPADDETGITSESDPHVGSTNNKYVCYGTGSQVTCADSTFQFDSSSDTLTTKYLKISGRTGCSKLYTDSSGNVLCGTDETGVSGSGVEGYVPTWESSTKLSTTSPIYIAAGGGHKPIYIGDDLYVGPPTPGSTATFSRYILLDPAVRTVNGDDYSDVEIRGNLWIYNDDSNDFHGIISIAKGDAPGYGGSTSVPDHWRIYYYKDGALYVDRGTDGSNFTNVLKLTTSSAKFYVPLDVDDVTSSGTISAQDLNAQELNAGDITASGTVSASTVNASSSINTNTIKDSSGNTRITFDNSGNVIIYVG